jgi:hypothetical protein
VGGRFVSFRHATKRLHGIASWRPDARLKGKRNVSLECSDRIFLGWSHGPDRGRPYFLALFFLIAVFCFIVQKQGIPRRNRLPASVANQTDPLPSKPLQLQDTNHLIVIYPQTKASPYLPSNPQATYRVSRVGIDGTFQKVGDAIGASFGDSGLTAPSRLAKAQQRHVGRAAGF